MGIEKKIREYVSILLYQHDLAPWRSERNQKRLEKIVEVCMKDLNENHNLLNELKTDSQIRYFVRQTIFYMIV